MGTDYLPESFNVTFEPSTRSATSSIVIVNDDILEMKTETALMVLSPSEGNVKDVCVATPGTATLGIIDDDSELEREQSLYVARCHSRQLQPLTTCAVHTYVGCTEGYCCYVVHFCTRTSAVIAMR